MAHVILLQPPSLCFGLNYAPVAAKAGRNVTAPDACFCLARFERWIEWLVCPELHVVRHIVNVRCLDKATVRNLRLLLFDGKNWEHSADTLAHLSEPPAK